MPLHSDSAPNLQSRGEVWSDYWRQGALHSLCGSLAGGLDGALRDFWMDAFSACAPGSRLLDLCTGNGVIPRLACESTRAGFARVDAVDLATLAPHWLAEAPETCRETTFFHGGTPIEALPFADRTFDLLTSQFGLEYCLIDLAVPELARVAAPQARLALVLHHSRSRLAQVAAAEAVSVAWLLSDSGPLSATAAIYPYLTLAAAGQQARLAGDDTAARARDHLNSVMQELVQRSERSACPDILFEARDFIAGQIRGVMQYKLTLEQTRLAHSAWASQLQAAAFRHRELCDHALDAAAASHLSEMLAREGFSAVDLQPLHHDEHLLGWRITGTRRD